MAKQTPKSGLFISFEGGEGSGKSSQIRHLKKWAKRQGRPVVVTREPGGKSSVGKEIRKLLLKPKFSAMADRCELLLYEADRAQNVEEIVLPALKKGAVVICDRHADSTTVYQGMCRGQGLKNTTWLNAYATGGLLPDLVFVLDVPIEVGLTRIRKRSALDRMEAEKKTFHEKVRRGFLKLARSNPRRYQVIDGTQPEKAIALEIQQAVEKRLRGKK